MTTVHPDDISPQRRYQQFRAREIEFYKQVVSYQSMMRIAADACERIVARHELSFGELTLAQEVDHIIAARVGVLDFKPWQRAMEQKNARKRAKAPAGEQLQLPLRLSGGGVRPVLILQPRDAEAWELLCDDGREVIIIEPDDAERAALETRAASAGWTHLVRTSATTQPLDDRIVFSSVLYSPAACADLTESETLRMIDGLKEATVPGGTHIVDGLIADREVLPQALLQRSYAGWKTRAVDGKRDPRFVTTRR